MNDKVLLGEEGKAPILKGINTICDAVKVTLGAGGRNVIIGDEFGNNHITKDGVTVAKSIILGDLVERMGSTLAKEVAGKTVEVSGDGTTTAIVLFQAIVNEGLKIVASGANPMELKKGIENAVSQVVEYLKEVSCPVDTDELLKQIASVSANNDTEIGSLVADIVKSVGEDGEIKVQSSDHYETTVEKTEGIKINSGYIVDQFVTNKENNTVELNNPYILLFEKKITSNKQFEAIINAVAAAARPLLIIAEDVEHEPISTLIVNKLRGSISCCAIKCPEFGSNRQKVMEDLSIITGAEFITTAGGKKLENTKLSMLGSAEKIIVDENSCIIIGGGGDKKEIETRCTQIKGVIENSKNEMEEKFNKIRLARITGGVAVIKVGGVTQTEIEEKKDRIDDAICATRAAQKEGFVAGGGSFYVFASDKIKDTSKTKGEALGIELIKQCLNAPFIQIMYNGGEDSENKLSELKGKSYGMGIDINTGDVVYMVKSGIVDPAKVVRVALENAASVAAIFLTTDCIISKQ